jgi:hypothetical protein
MQDKYCGCHTLILYADMNMFVQCEEKEQKEKIPEHFLQFERNISQKASFFKCKS